MHTLYLVMDPETLPLARDIYRLSQHRTQVCKGRRGGACARARLVNERVRFVCVRTFPSA